MKVRIDMIQHYRDKKTGDPKTMVFCSYLIPLDSDSSIKKIRYGWERLSPFFFNGVVDYEVDAIMEAVYDQRIYNGEVQSYCKELLYID